MLELEQARLQTTHLDYVSSLAKLDLLAIDDFGLMDLDLDKCRDLFEVIDGRDGRKSTIIVSQDAICQGAFLQKLQIVQQNLHEGYRGRIGCTV